MQSETPIVEEGTPEVVFDNPWRERTQLFPSQIIWRPIIFGIDHNIELIYTK